MDEPKGDEGYEGKVPEDEDGDQVDSHTQVFKMT